MHPAYFETYFDSHGFVDKWPIRFAIVTAWATTGTCRSRAVNEAANRQLECELQRRGIWRQRVTGYSLTTQHAEPGWAIKLPFNDACDLGLMFLQDAIYWVDAGRLFVTHCDAQREGVYVDEFRLRLRSL